MSYASVDLALLRKLEWSSCSCDDELGVECPCCRAKHPLSKAEDPKHKPNCALKAAIARAERDRDDGGNPLENVKRNLLAAEARLDKLQDIAEAGVEVAHVLNCVLAFDDDLDARRRDALRAWNDAVCALASEHKEEKE